MYQQDYLLRIIEQLGILLRRMRDAISEQEPDAAVEASTEAVGLVLDMDPRLAESLSAGSLVSLLGAGGSLDVARCLALGEVFVLQAEALRLAAREDAAGGAAMKARVLLGAVLDFSPDGDATTRAEELLSRLA